MITMSKVIEAVRNGEFAIVDHAEKRCWALGVYPSSLLRAMVERTERVVVEEQGLLVWVYRNGAIYCLTWSLEARTPTLSAVNINAPFGLRLCAETRGGKQHEVANPRVA